MRSKTQWATVLCILLASTSRGDTLPAKDIGQSGCGSYGTSVDFISTPSEAARQALKEQKLVFVLHVSGHFEDPGIT